MIKAVYGDLVESSEVCVVNTVNCMGVMGAGIAKKFKNKYPAMFTEYRSDCNNGRYNPGDCFTYFHYNNPLNEPVFPGLEKYRIIINAATKKHWTNKSEEGWIISCLQNIRWLGENKVRDNPVAMPPLGCGNGGFKHVRFATLANEYLRHSNKTFKIYTNDLDIYKFYDKMF